MNTETGQIKNMTDIEVQTSNDKWVPYNIVRIPSKQACRRAWRSKYTPHLGKKELARNDNI
jgi:hypothetical protein